MIGLLGDVHGHFHVVRDTLLAHPGIPFIQVGDFGYWPQLFRRYLQHQPERQFLFIDGNHDHTQLLSSYTEPQEIWPNAMYVPRGTVVEVDGLKVLCVGGATSVDRGHREQGQANGRSATNAWFASEGVTEADCARALVNARAAGRVDLLVTHTPPITIMRKWLPDTVATPPGRGFFRWPTVEGDISAKRIVALWQTLDFPPLFCGHIHRSIVDKKVRVLGIDEVYLYKGV